MKNEMSTDGSWFTYVWLDGTKLYSAERMTYAELHAHKKHVDALSASYVDTDPDDYDPYYPLGEPRVAA